MNAVMQGVNSVNIPLTENKLKGGEVSDEEFKLTLDNLLKGVQIKEEINPLIALLISVNPPLLLQDDMNQVIEDSKDTILQQNVPVEFTSRDASLLLESVEPLLNQSLVDMDEVEVKSLYSEHIINGKEMVEITKVEKAIQTNLDKTDSIMVGELGLTKETDGKKVDYPNDKKIISSIMEKGEEGKQINLSNKQNDTDGLKITKLLKQGQIEKNDMNLMDTSLKIFDNNTLMDNGVTDIKGLHSKPEIDEIFKQIIDGTRVLIKEKEKSEALISLKPPSLGKLIMQVIVDKNVVTAKITAQNHDVKNIIEANINQLKDSLDQQGMHVDNLTVSVDSGGFFNNGQRHDQGRRQQFIFADNVKVYENYEFYSYVDKDHVDCIV
ncbi:MAG: flagellar hook-length control protein FliK [Thermoanaerobacteraceae bacterium]|nr:flagellar hook-length control protein FliK [Thermoanaerobacteraceae bacterium]